MDLNPYTKPADYISEHIDKNHIVATSALNNMNIEYLKEQLYQSVLDGKLNLESTIVSNARHYDALQGAYTSLQQALDNLTMEISGDFVAMDIRHALRYLGEITGEISSDDLLESIFSRFCIGK
jgi:tRNA modification GTPase